MLSGATDVAAIASLVELFPKSIVRFLPSLHAKVYVSDSREAVITSANLTDNGLWRNFEYGVVIHDPAEVTRIRADILRYGDLGSAVTLPQLRAFAAVTDDLRLLRVRAEASLRHKLRVEFDKKLESMDEEVLRARAGDRSLDAILSDAILYLLRDRAMKTPEIHANVQRIHSDLCDDSIDRVINGVHFGKKWKHAVRRAQYHLKQRGRIKLVDRQWMLV
jgi:phosphatidylserine/phosphatidylglycerophosphate/cardiolipin synthase-like enzyme